MKKFMCIALMAMVFVSTFALNYPGIRQSTQVVLNGEGKVITVTVLCTGSLFTCLTSQDVIGMGQDLIYDGITTFEGIDILNESHVGGSHTYNVFEY